MTSVQFILKVDREPSNKSFERDSEDQTQVQGSRQSVKTCDRDGLQVLGFDQSEALISANEPVTKVQATTMPNMKSSRPLSAPSKQYSATTSKSHTLPAKSNSATVFSRDHLNFGDKESNENHSQVSIGTEDASTPLNLRHISMDETRIASIFHMDSIWRQVESGDNSPAVARHFVSELTADSSPDLHTTVIASHVQESSISDKVVDDAWSSPQHRKMIPSSNDHHTTQTLVTSTPVKSHSLVLDSTVPKVNGTGISDVKGIPLSNTTGEFL